MKRKPCIALAAMLLLGSVPAYGAEWANYEKKEIEHWFTAKVGTTEFRKNGELQPLDAEIYIKDGYVMLPLRTFLTAVEEDAVMTWDAVGKRAQVILGDEHYSFDINGNRIWLGNELLSVSGEMEVSESRVFVPLRNWVMTLRKYGYVVEDNDISWDAETQTAKIRAVEVELIDPTKPLNLTGTGDMPVYSMEPTRNYDDIASIGDGYFIAKKYVNTNGDRYGRPITQSLWKSDWFLLDATGNVLLEYDSEDVFSLLDAGEGYLQLNRKNAPNLVIDRAGEAQFDMEYTAGSHFSEGLMMVLYDNPEMEDADSGYIDTKGELAVPFRYYSGRNFSDGLAAAAVYDPGDSRSVTLYGYIDKDGEWVVEPQYFPAWDFRDGIARVTKNGRVGYIDKAGNEIVTPQYDWGSDFHEGKAFVKEKDGRVFQIDATGRKLKQITDGRRVSHFCDGILELKVSEDLGGGNVKYLDLYFDENGQISREEAELRAVLSEGLSVMWEEKSDKYGYADENGAWIIAPVFDSAEPFRDGYAAVANEITLENGETDVEWGIIRHPQQ